MFRVPLRSPPFSSRLRFPTNHRRFANGTLRNALFTRRATARVTLFAASSLALATTMYADSDVDAKASVPSPSLGSMVRAYSVFAMCSIPGLVEASPTILSALSSIPGLRQITEAFVRVTFFDQFVGADTADETIPLLRTLRGGNKGAIFAYSVEVDEREATAAAASPASAVSSSGSVAPKPDGDAHKRAVAEMIHSIDVAGDFEDEVTRNDSTSASADVRKRMNGRTTWIALKLTALLPHAQALIDLSAHIVNSRKMLSRSSREIMVPFPGFPRTDDLDVVLHSLSNPSSLTPAQVHDLRELYSDLVRICSRARERGVKVVIDAEYSWYQPAVDALTLALMREFNSPTPSNGEVQPLVYGTFQAYLRRTPMQLVLWLEDARKNNYALGAKLVRGAYHPHELAAHKSASTGQPSLSISPDAEPPVWLEKRDTDEAYNRCVGVLIRAVKEDIERGTTKAVAIEGPKDDAPVKKGWFASIFGAATTPNPRASETSFSIPQSPSAPMVSVLFGTHNWTSCGLVLKELVQNGLASETGRVVGPEGDKVIRITPEAAERLAIGQLYGMRDDLTDWVVSQVVSETPFMLKYVPYGALSEVMPYLSRRAIENKSVFEEGAARHERQRAGREIRRLLFG